MYTLLGSVKTRGFRVLWMLEELGAEFSVPDLIIGYCAGWMRRAGFDWPDGPVAEYFAHLQQRPAFQKAQDIRNAN